MTQSISGSRGAIALLALMSVFASGPQAEAASAETSAPIAELRGELMSLSPHVSAREARSIAICAHETSVELARQYGVVGFAHFHNFLVNAGFKRRGLCHHWTRDLIQRLRALKLTTIDLHWGAARAGTWREHNAVVVTARGQPFTSGIVLDPWRRSGRLSFGPVAADHYPWKEDRTECFCAARFAVKQPH